jgi:hypothetical protein
MGVMSYMKRSLFLVARESYHSFFGTQNSWVGTGHGIFCPWSCLLLVFSVGILLHLERGSIRQSTLRC